MASDSTSAPEWLDEDARRKWAELVALRPVWTAVQADALAAYCAAFSRWVAAERWLADPDHGPVVTIRDDKGNIRSHGPAPQLLVGERAAKEMSRLGPRLGIR